MKTYSEHQKTKTMIVARRHLAVASSFTFNGNVIETCKSYPYLGPLFSNNRKFKLDISELCQSASRAMYTFLGNVNKFSSGNVTILLDLLDKMILPICTYNFEVWCASFFLHKSSARDLARDLAEKQFYNPITRCIFEVYSWCLCLFFKLALKSETKRNSKLTKIIKTMIWFWSHIKESESAITHDT